MNETADLAGLIAQRADRLTPGQRRLASLILADPESFAFSRIADTAARAEVHPATVTRFATAIGLSGYPALVRLCQERLRQRARLVTNFDLLADTGSLPLAAAADTAAITATMAAVDPQQWAAVIACVADARRVAVLGARQSQAAATLLAYLLHLVRADVAQWDSGASRIADHVSALESGDVLIAISTRPYTRGTVEVARVAASRGITVIAVTDTEASPLRRHATAALQVESPRATLLPSSTAAMCLLQALASDVALRLGESARGRLAELDSLLSELQVLQD